MPQLSNNKRSRPASSSPRQREAAGGRQLQAVLDGAVEGIVVIDQTGIVQIFNRAAQRMFGYTPGEVIGRNVSILMAEPHRSRHGKYVADYLRTGRAQIIGVGREVEGLRKDGTTLRSARSTAPTARRSPESSAT
jgi:two-component system sensor histidine kinase/response regulator